MPLIDKATLVVGSGNFLVADVGTACPVDLKTFTAPETAAWDPIGHTSLEDVLTFDSEGGEQTVLGTLQNPNLRTTYTKRTESISIGLQQFDEGGLKLYYGSNAVKVGNLLQVPTNPVPSQKAFLALFLDQEAVFAIYMPKAEIFRGDNLEISDTESLATLPLKVTPLQYQTNNWTYAVTVMDETD